MSDEPHDWRGKEPSERGDTVPLNWTCTVCGYRIEGELPEKCPECGADRSEFEEVPIPGF